MLQTPGFHHIAFVSAGLQRSRIFYEDVLGLRLLLDRDRDERLQRSPYDLLFGDAEGSPGSLIAFIEDRDARKGHWGIGGIHHLALTVRDRDQQLRWKRWLTDHGVPVTGPYDRGYFHSIYFSDPDGHILELATQGPGYDFDEPADALGEQFIQPDEERLRGERDEATIRALTHPDPVEAIDDEMRLDGIHHITGITDRLDETHRMYTDGLGLSLVKKTVNQDDGETRHDFWARYEGTRVEPRSSITHFDWRTSQYRARPGTGQTRHIVFRSDSDDDLERWRDHLDGLGIEVGATRDHAIFRSLEFVAPDGLIHQIATPFTPPASTGPESEAS